MSNPGCTLRPVNERTLLIVAALGASVVAYAVYGLLSREVGPQPQRVSASSSPRDEPEQVVDEPAVPAPSRAPKGRLPAPRPTAKAGPAPALPLPDVSLEEAREDYDDLIAELERELQRNKDTGKPLATEHWVEYYQRGHEVMDPLRRLLGFSDDAGKQEVADKDEALRELMADLQADPATLKDEPEAGVPQNQ